MALILHNAGREPLGQFDGLDSQYLLFKGGEVCTWAAVQSAAYGGTDEAAADVNNDGYVGTTTKFRPAVTFTLAAATAPLFLADDGIANYGTLFGTVVGGVAGQVSSGGASLGPSTAAGSGKITLWDKMGIYGVTLDSCDQTNLVPTNSALTVGSKLSYTATGQITPVANSVSGGTGAVIGYLASFETNGSLVRTPQNLVAALNSPSSDVSSVLPLSFYQAVFSYVGV